MSGIREQLENKESYNVGVFGATGVVGEYMLRLLDERNFPVAEMRPYASERSAGKLLTWQERDYTVEDASKSDFTGLDIAFFSAGATTSRKLAPLVAEAGVIVIDNSSAWRSDPQIPLVVSEVNPHALKRIPRGIIANPNCTTMVAMPVLKPLHDRAGLEKLVITTFQAVSGAGQRGIEELQAQSSGISSDAQPSVFREPVSFNVFPFRGNPVDGDTDEELKLLHESRKILDIAELAVSATCWTVPVYTGHSLSIEATFRDAISPELAEKILAQAAGVQLVDIPTPLKAAGGDVSLVGRIRQSGAEGDHGLSMCISGDNLRKGAALNAIQIAELLIGR